MSINSSEFKQELKDLLNKHGIDSYLDAPDSAIADMLIDHLIDVRDADRDIDEEGDPGDMDGDAASALASAGLGTDEDYGGGDERY